MDNESLLEMLKEPQTADDLQIPQLFGFYTRPHVNEKGIKIDASQHSGSLLCD